jgi:hypothetical protein
MVFDTEYSYAHGHSSLAVSLSFASPKQEISSDFNNFSLVRIAAWMVGENMRVVNPQSH